MANFKKDLEEKLDEFFPKGKCKERGQALVLFAEAVMLHNEEVKRLNKRMNEENEECEKIMFTESEEWSD